MVEEYMMKVAEVREWSEGIKSVFLEYIHGPRMDFKAGQYVLLQAEIGGRKISRAYSIASTPLADRIEILFRVAGVFTRYLNELKVGDEIKMIGAFGRFSIDKAKERRIVYIATGTGITPLLSMIRTMHQKNECGNFEKVVFVYGTRYESTLVYKNEFEEHEKNCGNFEFVPVLSREKEWQGKRGHVQDVLDEFIGDNTDYFICGLPAMVDDVEKMLLQRGISKENIFIERY